MLPPPASEAPSISRRAPGFCLRGMEPQPSRSVPRPLRLRVSTFEAPCLGRRAPALQARSSGLRLLLIDWTVLTKIPDVPKGPPDGPLGRAKPPNGLPDRHRFGVVFSRRESCGCRRRGSRWPIGSFDGPRCTSRIKISPRRCLSYAGLSACYLDGWHPSSGIDDPLRDRTRDRSLMDSSFDSRQAARRELRAARPTSEKRRKKRSPVFLGSGCELAPRRESGSEVC
jgi:hypothetical protein